MPLRRGQIFRAPLVKAQSLEPGPGQRPFCCFNPHRTQSDLLSMTTTGGLFLVAGFTVESERTCETTLKWLLNPRRRCSSLFPLIHAPVYVVIR